MITSNLILKLTVHWGQGLDSLDSSVDTLENLLFIVIKSFMYWWPKITKWEDTSEVV